MTEPNENVDNPAAPDADLDPEPYGADDAVADEQDGQAEQTDNAGEEDTPEAPQGEDDVSDDDLGDEDDDSDEEPAPDGE